MLPLLLQQPFQVYWDGEEAGLALQPGLAPGPAQWLEQLKVLAVQPELELVARLIHGAVAAAVDLLVARHMLDHVECRGYFWLLSHLEQILWYQYLNIFKNLRATHVSVYDC